MRAHSLELRKKVMAALSSNKT